MRKDPPEIDFAAEEAAALKQVLARVGQETPLSLRYVLGSRPTLVSVDGQRATLQYPNGAILSGVPLRDLVDDSGFWKR